MHPIMHPVMHHSIISSSVEPFNGINIIVIRCSGFFFPLSTLWHYFASCKPQVFAERGGKCFTNVLPIYPLNSSFTTPQHFKGEIDLGTKKPRKHWV